MLSGEVSLEDFVHKVESSSGMERWALWMEISGRLQIAQQQNDFPNGVEARTYDKKGADALFPIVSTQNKNNELSKLRTAERRSRIDEIRFMERDRMLAQSIMKKQVQNTRSTQVIDSDFTAIPYFDDGITEIALDSSRPDEMARIVRASSGAASRRAEHPQPNQGRLHSTGPGP